MATAYLNRVSTALEASSAVDICLEHFRSAGKVDKQTAATEYASASLDRLRELLKSQHGIRIYKLEDKEIATIVQDARTKEASSISAKEYQELMEHIVKYAALRARRSPRRRFAFGVACSAASAVAVTAVTAAASAGLLVAAAPVGAAVGALAVGASSLGLSKRDKRRAAKHIAPLPATAAPVAAEEITTDVEAAPTIPQADEAAAANGTPMLPAAAPAGAEDTMPAADQVAESAVKVTGPVAEAETAAAAAHPAPLETQTTPNSDDVSAVVELSSPAVSAAAPAKETPFSGVTVPFPTSPNGDLAAPAAPAPAADNTEHILAAVGAALADREPESLPLPELMRCDTPDNADSAQELLTPAASLDVAKSSDLPPLAKKKKSASKKIKKSLSKGYKSIKKAMSISSSGELDAAAAAAVARADRDAAALPPPGGKPPSGFSFRRSFSRDSARDMDLTVQGSDGSATLKKMKEMLRRSFTISPRTSVDLSSGGNAVHAV